MAFNSQNQLHGSVRGVNGANGNGIASIEKTGTLGLVDTYTITFTDGNTEAFNVTNGAKGDTGNTGNGISSVELNNDYTLTINFTNGESYTTTSIRGMQGEKGDNPIKGVDYFTNAEIQEFKDDIVSGANSDFNANVTEKMTAFNSNAASKTNTFNDNVTIKTNAFNTNATDKTDTFDSNASTKTSAFNSNVTSKTSDFDTNATNKTTAYNQNATTKTSEYNTNAQTKLDTYNTNATAKMTAYNENAEEKVQEYNDNASALMQSVDELENAIENINIAPKNIGTLFNDDFYALPFRQMNEINKNGTISTNYADNIKKINGNTANATEGTGQERWINSVINSDFAPKVTNGNVDFPVDIVLNISSDNEGDTFSVYLNSRGDWSNGANYYFYTTKLKQGINIVRLGTGTKANIPDNTMLNYIIVRNEKGNNFKASISAFKENNALYNLANKLVKPSMIDSNFNDDFQAIPFKQFDLINKGKTVNFPCDNTKISANTHDIEEGTGTSSYIRFIINNNFIPEAVNQKFERPLDVFLNIDSDDANQTYRVILSSGSDWNPNNSQKSINIKGNGLHHVRFDGSGHNHYNKTTYPNILLTNTNSNYNIKATITAYYENNIINNIYDEINEINTKIASDKEIVCWGDSLTAQGGWTTRLQELSGITVYNAGTGGESAKTIMARQGGDIMLINNITIPADTTPILIASRSTDVGIPTYFGNKVTPLLQGGNGVNPVKIGDIEGTLLWTGSSYNDQTGTWTFTRSEAGEAVVIDRPTAIRTNFDRIHNSPYLMIIFMGQNGGYDDINDLINKHKLMIEHAKAENVIVLGLSSGSASSRAAYETAMRNEFGRYFISLREYLASPIYDNNEQIIGCYGLADQNLTPTATDLEQIATGTVPDSCLADSVHYTSGTKTVIGNMLYKKCCELGIF